VQSGLQSVEASFERFVAEPQRSHETSSDWRTFLRPPPPLKFIQTSVKVAQEKPEMASIGMRLGVVRPDRQRHVVACKRFIEASDALTRHSMVHESGGFGIAIERHHGRLRAFAHPTEIAQ
jgi:hypothetical protein